MCVLARGFSWQHRITEFTSYGYASPLRICERRIYLSFSLQVCPSITTDWYGYLPASPHRLTTTRPGPTQPAIPFPRRDWWTTIWVVSRTDSSGAPTHGYGNINPLSIDYACRPRLRSRLTQGGLAWPWNPWSFGGRVSHPSFATHACILTRVASTAGFPRRFTRHTTLPYPSELLDHKGLEHVRMPQLRRYA